jgi:uncharacterized damage-inducible protein DinB
MARKILGKMRKIEKPESSEYPEYFSGYVNQFKGGENILLAMQDNFSALKSLISELTDEKLLFRYAPEKWSVKEILVHMMDAERIFLVRALRLSRNDKTKLPGFDQDEYIPYTQADELSKERLLKEYKAVRNSTFSFLDNLPEEALSRKGMVNGVLHSVRAIAYQIAGHEQHHINILKERYL